MRSLFPDEDFEMGAQFSDCDAYRYLLWRVWEVSLPSVLFIGLNPSTADHQKNDPTMRRCIAFAKSWGYGSMYVANLFGYRTKSPELMKKAKAPIGADNDAFVLEAHANCDRTVLMWGNHGTHLNRDQEMLDKLEGPLYCFKLTKSGQPAHPLYLPADKVVQAYGH